MRICSFGILLKLQLFLQKNPRKRQKNSRLSCICIKIKKCMGKFIILLYAERKFLEEILVMYFSQVTLRLNRFTKFEELIVA